MAALAGEALAERQADAVCPSCSMQLAPHAAFCHRCGHQMGGAAPSLEQYDRTVRELMGRLRGQGVLEPVARI